MYIIYELNVIILNKVHFKEPTSLRWISPPSQYTVNSINYITTNRRE